MPKKKARKSPARSTSQELSSKHPNAIWLFPLLILLVAIFMFVYNQQKEEAIETGTNPEVREMLYGEDKAIENKASSSSEKAVKATPKPATKKY